MANPDESLKMKDLSSGRIGGGVTMPLGKTIQKTSTCSFASCSLSIEHLHCGWLLGAMLVEPQARCANLPDMSQSELATMTGSPREELVADQETIGDEVVARPARQARKLRLADRTCKNWPSQPRPLGWFGCAGTVLAEVWPM